LNCHFRGINFVGDYNLGLLFSHLSHAVVKLQSGYVFNYISLMVLGLIMLFFPFVYGEFDVILMPIIKIFILACVSYFLFITRNEQVNY